MLKYLTFLQTDWNKVANNPILAHEITNGHAARMRFSRFRKALLGLEPTRRNRTGTPNSRVTKSKKEPKPKTDERVKSEPATRPTTPKEATEPLPSNVKQENPPKVKQEAPDTGHEAQVGSRITPRLTPGPMAASMPVPMAASMPTTMPTPAPSMMTGPTIHPRLLTPCSDTDIFTPLATSPASDMVNSHSQFEPPASPFTQHDQNWHQSLPYSSFLTPYSFSDFGVSVSDHQHYSEDYIMVNQSIEVDDEEGQNIAVKREWDDCA